MNHSSGGCQYRTLYLSYNLNLFSNFTFQFRKSFPRKIFLFHKDVRYYPLVLLVYLLLVYHSLLPQLFFSLRFSSEVSSIPDWFFFLLSDKSSLSSFPFFSSFLKKSFFVCSKSPYCYFLFFFKMTSFLMSLASFTPPPPPPTK